MKAWITASIFVAMAAMATPAHAAGVWTPWVVVTEVQEYGDGVRVMNLDVSGSRNPAGCPLTNQAHVSPLASDAQRDRMGRQLQAAFLAGREIQLKIHDTRCSADGTPVYYAVRVR